MFLVITIYKTRLMQAATVRSLLAIAPLLENATLFVWDNSPSPAPAEDRERLRDAGDWTVDYRHDPANSGLSRVYNEAVRHGADHDTVTILDQDSTFDRSLVDRLREALRTQPECDVFLPIVESHGRIVSPGNYRLVKGSYWTRRTTGRISARGVTAINSGMTIRTGYLRNEFPGYDERFRFYGIDTAFMLDHAKRRPYVYVLDATILHESGLLDGSQPEARRIERFDDLFRAWILLHEDRPAHLALVRAYTLYVGLREAVRRRDGTYLRCASRAAFRPRSPAHRDAA